MTHEHADTQAAFSEDGEWVVFVRAAPGWGPYGKIYKIRRRPGAKPVLLLALAGWSATSDLLVEHNLRTGRTSVLVERVVSPDYIVGGKHDSCMAYHTRTLDLQYPMWLWCRDGVPKIWAEEGAKQLPFLNAVIAAGGKPLLSYQYR